MRKIILLLFICFPFVKNTFSQVTIIDKTITYSYSNEFDCYAYEYSITCPFFDFMDTEKFSYSLNDSIHNLFVLNSSNWVIETNFDFINNPFPCSSINDVERMNADYTVTTNSKNILSFTINNSWEAGGGGSGAYGSVTCFTIDINTKSYLNIDSFFNPKNKSIVLKLFEKQMNEPVDSLNPSAPQYIGITINDSVMMVYYTFMASGSKQFYNQYYIPLKDLKKYMTKRSIKLLFGEADKPKKK